MNIQFDSPPEIVLATNTFINIPVVLKYDETPLIEMIHTQDFGFTTRVHIYHSDGSPIGNVTGKRLFLVNEEKQVAIDIKETTDKLTCRLLNKVVFQIASSKEASLNMMCELYIPGGYMVKCSGWSKPQLFDPNGDIIPVGGVLVNGCIFRNSPVGIWLKQNGSCILG